MLNYPARASLSPAQEGQVIAVIRIRNPKLCKAIEHLIDRWGPINGRARLTKLIYLADQAWAQQHGSPYTEADYYRWNHGPFSREILQAIEWMDGVEIVEDGEQVAQGAPHRYTPGVSTRLKELELHPEFVRLLDRVGQEWRGRPLRDLLDYVYGDESFSRREFGENLFSKATG
jgi:hypothetical protein